MNLIPLVSSNFRAARISPMLPSLIRSASDTPWFWYFFATATTNRRFERTSVSSASVSPARMHRASRASSSRSISGYALISRRYWSSDSDSEAIFLAVLNDMAGSGSAETSVSAGMAAGFCGGDGPNLREGCRRGVQAAIRKDLGEGTWSVYHEPRLEYDRAPIGVSSPSGRNLTSRSEAACRGTEIWLQRSLPAGGGTTEVRTCRTGRAPPPGRRPRPGSHAASTTATSGGAPQTKCAPKRKVAAE